MSAAAAPGPRAIRLADISAAVLKTLGVNIRTRSRKRRVSLARSVAAYVARNHTDASLHEIGIYLCGTHHTSVHYSARMIERRRAATPEIERAIRLVVAELGREL